CGHAAREHCAVTWCSIVVHRGHHRFDRIGRDRFIACGMIRARDRAFGEELSQGAVARTTFRVKGSKSSRKKACSQELAAKEGIGRGSGEISVSYRSPTADPRGAPT